MTDEIMRKALWATAGFNVFGALLFGFPDTFGWLAGMPTGVPAVYRALLALFILLFGGAYAWLANRRVIDRPFVVFAAVGKAGAFFVVFACWIAGTLPLLSVVAITGDLLFALLFAWWLAGGSDGVAVRA
jgi:hypothetical protein